MTDGRYTITNVMEYLCLHCVCVIFALWIHKGVKLVNFDNNSSLRMALLASLRNE